MVNNLQTGLTFRDLIQAQLDGKTVQYWTYSEGGKWTDSPTTMQIHLDTLDNVVDGKKFRIKPTKLQPTTLTNREVLTALLEGKVIQEARIEVGENTPTKWFNVVYCPFFTTDDLDEPFNRPSETEDLYIYRIKPETETVRVFNGVELPQCITEPLQEGDIYYAATLDGVAVRIWKGRPLDISIIQFGHAYKTPEDAEVHCGALTTYKTIEKEVLK